MLAVLCVACMLARADELGAYLEQHNLRDLLAVHLEQQLEEVDPERRSELILRLSALYTELLESTVDDEARTELERRSRTLLQHVPADRALDLRFALARARYRQVETTAEQHRMRLADPAAVENARSVVEDLTPELETLTSQVEEAWRSANRDLTRSSGSEAARLTDFAESKRILLKEARFITAWAQYYRAWLSGRPEAARRAQHLFSLLLELDPDKVFPEEVSVDARAAEPIARSILGMGLAKSQSASSGSAIAWLALLDDPATFEPIRHQADIWRIVIRLEHAEYDDAQRIYERHREQFGEPPVQWLRLMAVAALEAGAIPVDALSLSRFALTELAARGELAQVLDIAERYGTEALGSSGFAPWYVHGVLAYQDARRTHTDDRPSADTAVNEHYEQAIDQLRAAVNASDADRYPGAAADAQRLIAWSLYFLGRYNDARAAFEAAADQLGPEQAPDALWMAVVAQERLASVSNSPAVQNQLAALMSDFLQRYPSSEHAPKLLLRQSIQGDEGSLDSIERLLAVPRSSEVHESAQRQAANLIYRRFRGAESRDRRIELGVWYLDVASRLMQDDNARLVAKDPVDQPRLTSLSRRVLEVALYSGIDEPQHAQRAFNALDRLEEAGADLSPHADELAYRRVRLNLINNKVDAADAIAEELWQSDPTTRWADLAARAMFINARRAQQRAHAPEHASRIITHGTRILGTIDDGSDPPQADSSATTTIRAAVAEALASSFADQRNREHGRQALTHYERLLEANPNNADFLRHTADLAEQFDRIDLALSCWRRILARAGETDMQWFEARYRLISLLAAVNLARAREVMDQHRTLNPDYGPDPWGTRLRALDQRITASPSAGTDDQAGEAP